MFKYKFIRTLITCFPDQICSSQIAGSYHILSYLRTKKAISVWIILPLLV